MQPSRYNILTWSACVAVSLVLAACTAAPMKGNDKNPPPSARSSRSATSKSSLKASSSQKPARILRQGTIRTTPQKVSVQAPKPSSSSRRSR